MKAYVEKRRVLEKAFGVDCHVGLTTEQVQRNRNQYGHNGIAKCPPPTFLQRVWDATTEPMILMLLGAWVLAIGINLFRAYQGQETDYWECVGIFVAIALSVIISVIMEGKSAKAFEELTGFSENIVVRVLRNGKACEVRLEDVVVGDIVFVGAGDKIPADGRVIEEFELYCDESMLTGESHTIHKKVLDQGLPEETPLAERYHMCYRGSFVTGGVGKILVTAVGDKTEFGCIACDLQSARQKNTPLQEKLSHLGEQITVLGIIAATIVFIAQCIRMWVHGTMEIDVVLVALVTSVVLIVAAVPEGLPTIVAVSLSLNIIKLSKKNALVKKMIACETVGCIDIICSDKTGTLTENKMKVQRYYTDHFVRGDRLKDSYLIWNLCCNTTARLAPDGSFIGNPTECALLHFYQSSAIAKSTLVTYSRIRAQKKAEQLFPFSSEEKHMTSIIAHEGRWLALTKGSPEAIVAMCRLSERTKKRIFVALESVQSKGMRVIAFAHKFVKCNKDYSDARTHRQMESAMHFDGFVAIADPLRKEILAAQRACESAGVELKILTGDHPATARAIAEEMGLLRNDKRVVVARDLENISDEELCAQLSTIAVIARSTPRMKMRVVQCLQSMGHVVAVTGDGINDAPALKHADVGLSMGITGSEVSKQASDIVLLNDSFATFVQAIEWGRNIYENFKRFILFQLTVNFASVVVVFVSILMGLKAPFTALQLLWVNIIMDGPPALTLGLEPNHRNLMQQKPIKRTDPILSKVMLYRIFGMGTFMALLFLGQYHWNYLEVPAMEESTVLFTFFVCMQLFNSFNCRELHEESVFRYIWINPLMLIVVGCTFLLQVLFVQMGSAFFGTVPLSLETWGKILAVSSSVLWGFELLKWIYRQRKALKVV